jgi:outer membrane protein assembly factor BamD (BamD/ComL family)
MEEKIKTKKGFIQIPILIAIIVSVVVASGIGYGAIEYHKTSKIIKEAEQLAKEEKYDEAIGKLEIAQNKFLGKTILKQKINAELETNKKLLEDKSEYTQGIEEFNKGNWEKARELLSKVSENFPYYQDAKNKIEQAQAKITEKRVAEEVEKVKEKAKKEVEEIKKVAEETQKEAEEERTVLGHLKCK